MSQARFNTFVGMVQTAAAAANRKFTESRSSVKSLLQGMRQQLASGVFDLNALRPAIASARADKRGTKYEAALKYVENTWGKAAVQYKGPNEAGFTDVAGRLSVLKGTVVTFREVDTGTQTTHTFSTASTSSGAAGDVAVNLAFGTNTYPVRALVFELVPQLTFGDNFVGRSTTDVGVNEHVTLGFTTVPAGLSAAQAGTPLWALEGAIPANADQARQSKGKLQRASGDTSAPAADGTAYFIAPWTTDASYPTAPRPSARSKAITLRLTVQSGVSQGLYVDQQLTVHTLQARMVATAPYKHTHGKPSAGFTGDIYFDPKNVSFRYVKFKEGRGTQVAKQTGFREQPDVRSLPRQLPQAPSGYFAWEHARVHQNTPVWVDIGSGDATNGCKLNGSDDVYSGWNQRWPARYVQADGAAIAGKETNVPSETKWPIYWKYRAEDLATEVLAQQVTHHAIMDAAGTVTMQKAGATLSRRLNDPTE